jgi:acyl-CoA synthetase (AMP-forming)/AMP-acid ligase II
MKIADDGTLWMHTGDECLIDEAGYCHVLGRIKDIIIRGTSASPLEKIPYY